MSKQPKGQKAKKSGAKNKQTHTHTHTHTKYEVEGVQIEKREDKRRGKDGEGRETLDNAEGTTYI